VDRKGNVLKLNSVNVSGGDRGNGAVLGRQENANIAVGEVVVVQGWAKRDQSPVGGGDPYFVIGTANWSDNANTRLAKIHDGQTEGEWYPFQISYRNGTAGNLRVFMGIFNGVNNNAEVSNPYNQFGMVNTIGISVYFDDIYVYRNQ